MGFLCLTSKMFSIFTELRQKNHNKDMLYENDQGYSIGLWHYFSLFNPYALLVFILFVRDYYGYKEGKSWKENDYLFYQLWSEVRLSINFTARNNFGPLSEFSTQGRRKRLENLPKWMNRCNSFNCNRVVNVTRDSGLSPPTSCWHQ